MKRFSIGFMVGASMVAAIAMLITITVVRELIVRLTSTRDGVPVT